MPVSRFGPAIPAKRAKSIERRFNSGTTPADLAAALKASGLPVTMINPELGKVYQLTKQGKR